jgi:hypothetical protein
MYIIYSLTPNYHGGPKFCMVNKELVHSIYKEYMHGCNFDSFIKYQVVYVEVKFNASRMRMWNKANNIQFSPSQVCPMPLPYMQKQEFDQIKRKKKNTEYIKWFTEDREKKNFPFSFLCGLRKRQVNYFNFDKYQNQTHLLKHDGIQIN